MHRCLSVVEVQLTIFRQIPDNFLVIRRGARRHATLARLARTCRTFTNAALDVLWEELDSIIDLIRCLPRDLWKINSSDDFERDTVVFQRAMSRSDWETLFSYSSRIRTLRLGSTSPWPDNNVVIALSHPPSPGLLAPRLKTLLLMDEGYLPLLQPLLTHSLVKIRFPSLVVRSPDISKYLISTCPSLKDLHIQGSAGRLPSTEYERALLEMVSQLHSLESFTYHEINEPLLVTLSHLPSLLTLSGSLRDDLESEKLRSNLAPLPPPIFPSLVSMTLELGNNKLSILTSLLEHMHSSLQTVKIILCVPPTLDMLYLFFTALANACDSERPSNFSLTTAYDWPFRDDHIEVSLSTYRPLLALSSMQSFTFDMICNLSLDDNAIDTLTTHWPRLTSLSFNASCGWGIESGVTHRGLIKLLSCCPLLTSFALEVDFSRVDGPPASIPQSRLGSNLTGRCRHAHFVSSIIKFPFAIAAFLSDILPGLYRVSSSWDEYDEDRMDESDFDVYSAKWEEVNQLLPGFLILRRQYSSTGGGRDGVSR